MASWLAPFVVVGVLTLLYFIGGDAKKPSFIRDLNFYMICVVVTAVVSIIANARYGRDWTDIAAWVLAGIAIAAGVWRWKTATPADVVVTTQDKGPLG